LLDNPNLELPAATAARAFAGLTRLVIG